MNQLIWKYAEKTLQTNIIQSFIMSNDVWTTNNVAVYHEKTKISIGIISQVWSETSLSPRKKLGFFVIHWRHSEDWSDWADRSLRLARSFWWFCHIMALHLSHVAEWKLFILHGFFVFEQTTQQNQSFKRKYLYQLTNLYKIPEIFWIRNSKTNGLLFTFHSGCQ